MIYLTGEKRRKLERVQEIAILCSLEAESSVAIHEIQLSLYQDMCSIVNWRDQMDRMIMNSDRSQRRKNDPIKQKLINLAIDMFHILHDEGLIEKCDTGPHQVDEYRITEEGRKRLDELLNVHAR